MNFLVWWNPFTWPADILNNVVGGILHGFKFLFYYISTFVYEIIYHLYNLFLVLCKSRILEADVVDEIANRIKLILGIVMLFFVIISTIQMLLDPDKITDKEKGAGNIAKKIIIVIVMLGTVSFVFQALTGLQNVLIDSNIVSKLLLPSGYYIEEENVGGILSSELFGTFYAFNDELDVESDEEIENCYNRRLKLLSNIKRGYGFSEGYACLGSTAQTGENEQVDIINFNPLLMLGIGVVVAYFLLIYCLSVGVRTIQLAFLEIISPVAIISYLSPKKDNMFEKWYKLYFSTYIDVFIRIMIINFAIFLIATIFENDKGWTFWNNVSVVGIDNNTSTTFIKVIMILALLTFAKKAPELLKNLFPSSGGSGLGFGMKSPKKVFDDMLGGNFVKGFAMASTVGTAIGLAGGIASARSRYQINKKNGKSTKQALLGAAVGGFGGYARGLFAGTQKGNVFSNFSKGIKNQRSIDDKYDELIASGGSTPGKIMAGVTSYFGETKGQEYTRKIKINENVRKSYDAINDAAEGITTVKDAKTTWENAKARGLTDTEIRALYKAYKDEKKRVITQALEGKKEFEDAEDQAIAANIRVHKRDLNNLIATGQIELTVEKVDENGKKYNETIKDFNNYANINDASIAASDNIATIKSSDDYNSAIANDKAAGVDSNGSKK